MGSPDNDGDAYDDEKPLHWVGLPDYYIGETVVTRALWKAVMLGYRTLPNGDDLPVTNNKWNSTSNLEGVQDFINRLNKALQDKLPQGRHFRLPTEAEWEYAARGGKKSHGYKYSGSNDIDDVAWYEGNSNGEIHPVKTKKPNELGLYNMSGNVWEWCHNMFESYRIEEEQGVQLVSRRVYRGGSWYDTARGCRVVHRGYAPGNHGKQGFRLVLA